MSASQTRLILLPPCLVWVLNSQGIICVCIYFSLQAQNDKNVAFVICTSQNWHVCWCHMHQRQATSTFWTFVSPSLGGWAPAADVVALWRFRKQRADLRRSAASWKPLWGPGQNGSCALMLITTWEHQLSEMAGQTQKKHTRDAVTHTQTHKHTLRIASAALTVS